MSEYITMNEVNNPGTEIHLYFNGYVGLYVAYGISAFLLSKETEVSPSYSVDMQMPAAVINVAHYNLLKEKLEIKRETENYRCLKVTTPYDENEYAEWASNLRGIKGL